MDKKRAGRASAARRFRSFRSRKTFSREGKKKSTAERALCASGAAVAKNREISALTVLIQPGARSRGCGCVTRGRGGAITHQVVASLGVGGVEILLGEAELHAAIAGDPLGRGVAPQGGAAARAVHRGGAERDGRRDERASSHLGVVRPRWARACGVDETRGVRGRAAGLGDARVSLGENSSVRECVGTRSRVCDEARGASVIRSSTRRNEARTKKFGDRYFLASA